MARTKSKQLNIRLTEKEYERLHSRAAKANVHLSAYILTMTFKGKIVKVEGLAEVSKELRAIGNNLNQITRLCHEGRIDCVNLVETKEEVAKLWQSLNLQIQKEV